MKRMIRANSSSDVLLRSSENNFMLVEESGVGLNNTSWTGLDVRSKGLADKHVIKIVLHTDGRPDFDGEPVIYHYQPYVTITHGFRSDGENETLGGVQECIGVLQEAVDFGKEIERYLKSSEWVK